MSLAEAADRIGRYLCAKADLESETGKISYGVECVLVLIISVFSVLLAGWLADAFQETLIVALTLLIVKYIIGGPHLSGFFRCVVFSTIYIVGVALLLKFFLNRNFTVPVGTMIAIFTIGGTFIVWFYAPLIREGVSLSRRQIRQRKLWSGGLLYAMSIANVVWTDIWLRWILIGIILGLFNITPVGVRLVGLLESITKRKGV